MSDSTIVATLGIFGDVTDRIVAVGTLGMFDELELVLDIALAIETVSISDYDVDVSITDYDVDVSITDYAVTVTQKNRLN